MNLLIAAAPLADATRTAARGVHADGHRPNSVLNCVRLTAEIGLDIRGTNLDMDVRATLGCHVLEPGEAVVDAQKLSAITSKFKGDVRIEGAADHLIIKNGRSRFSLTKRFIEYFPPPLVVDGEPRVNRSHCRRCEGPFRGRCSRGRN
jgi:DNA polymerase III sliding clamp (beta) subunit (PCNA family)